MNFDNFLKVLFVYLFIKKFEQKFYCCVEKTVKLFDRMMNKRDFLKIVQCSPVKDQTHTEYTFIFAVRCIIVPAARLGALVIHEELMVPLKS